MIFGVYVNCLCVVMDRVIPFLCLKCSIRFLHVLSESKDSRCGEEVNIILKFGTKKGKSEHIEKSPMSVWRVRSHFQDLVKSSSQAFGYSHHVNGCGNLL